jgi:hypothetical protein
MATNKLDWRTKEGRAAYARAQYPNSRDKIRNWGLMAAFGITLAEYSVMVLAQENKCAICRRPESDTRGGKTKALAVDHDHATGKIRGLLCARCNRALGMMEEDREMFISAIRYLDKHAGLDPIPLRTI